MNLVASLIVKNENGRYLRLAIAHLLTYCEEIRVIDDGSDDGSYEWLQEQERVFVKRNDRRSFFEHEGEARQNLLEWTLDAAPTHVLAIDADEFVANGVAMRRTIEQGGTIWMPIMEEVWKADENWLHVRVDGGWKPHPVPIVYIVPKHRDGSWCISPRQLACGREPLAVRNQFRNALSLSVPIFHFGWTRELERQARYQRYVDHDSGRFHAPSHLDSIMWPDNRVRFIIRPWPTDLPREEIVHAIQAVPA